MSHAAERIAIEMFCMYSNGTVSFSEGLATFAEELRSVQPGFFFAVPRLWLKFKEGVDAKIPPAAQAQLTEEQKAGIRHMLGLSKATTMLTGSAPCPRDVQQWFIDMGMWLRDGYGMTENFIDGCSWKYEEVPPVPGCVGKPMSKAEVRVSSEGEILFRSKGLMKGYYKEPEKTAEVLVDGWYRTGDTRAHRRERQPVGDRTDQRDLQDLQGQVHQADRAGGHVRRTELLAQFCVCGHGLDQPVLLTTLSESGRGLDRGPPPGA